MFVLRVIFRTGTTLDLTFSDIGTATGALVGITERRISGEQIEVLDDAGRQFRFSGLDILIEGLIDVERETTEVVRLGVIIGRATEVAKLREGVVDPQQPDPAAFANQGLMTQQPRGPARFSS
jgi:hypothetical protein